MKLNWAERLAVNNPLRILQQRLEIGWMMHAAPLPPGAHVLEIGCGRGAGAQLIRNIFHPAVIHATDIDRDMLGRTPVQLPDSLKKNITFSLVDAERLAFGGGTLDAVFGFGILHHLEDWRAALAEIRRVLKRGGMYYFEELYPALYQNCITRHILLHPRRDRFYSHDLKAALKQAGFTVRHSIELKGVGILGVCIKAGCVK